MGPDSFDQYAAQRQRKNRREGVLLIVSGAVFVAVGMVLMFVPGRFWIGIVVVCLGIVTAVGGIAARFGTDRAPVRVALLLGTVAFFVLSAVILVVGLIAPVTLGPRSVGASIVGGVGVVVSAFCLVLVVRQIRRGQGGAGRG